MDGELASVREVVDLSPNEALDEAQDFLTRQGYSVTYRTTTTLTVKRQVSDSATGQESVFKLIVMALPQSGGGVRIKVTGDDREAVRDHRAAWSEWSEALPKRETEQPEARYCGNCGHELSEEAGFCPSCGRPVHETAHVPTPEADAQVPPPAGTPYAGSAPPPQQGSMVGRSFGAGFGASIGWIVGGCLVLVVVLTVLFVGCAALLAGSS